MSKTFKIICCDDPVLLEFYIHSEFPDYTKISYIDDPFASRQLFIGKSFLTISNDSSLVCYICKNQDVFLSAEKYWDSLLNDTFSKKHLLLLVVDKIDSRTKFSKKFKSDTITLDASKFNICAVLPAAKALKKEQLTDMFNNCGQSFTKLKSEFDKVIKFADYSHLSVQNAYDELIQNNALTSSVDDNVFNLVEDIINKDIKSVSKKLYILDKTEFDFSLLVNLYNTLRNLYMYEECIARGTLNTSGLSTFTIKNVAKFHNKYTKTQLIGILRFLQKIDTGIKSGTLSSDYALDYMIVGVLSS